MIAFDPSGDLEAKNMALEAVVLRRLVDVVAGFALEIPKVVKVWVREHMAGDFAKFRVSRMAFRTDRGRH